MVPVGPYLLWFWNSRSGKFQVSHHSTLHLSRSAYISKKVKSIHACKYSELLINETLWKVNSVFFTICNKQPKIAYNSWPNNVSANFLNQLVYQNWFSTHKKGLNKCKKLVLLEMFSFKIIFLLLKIFIGNNYDILNLLLVD